MTALFKNLRQAANDLRPQQKPRVTPLITLPQQRRRHLWLRLGGVMLGVITVVSAVWFTQSQKQIDSETKPVLVSSLAQPTPAPAPIKIEVKPTPAAEPPHYTDIVLPAESLDPLASMDAASIAPPPEGDPTVAVIAEKLGDVTNASLTNSVEAHAIHLNDNVDHSENQLLSGAYALLKGGNYAAALALYNQVLAVDPENHAALTGKTYALQHGDAAKSATELEHMVAVNPDDAVTQAAFAKSLAAKSDYVHALPHLDRAARLDPANLSYRLSLAILYDHAGHANEALTLYRQVLRAESDSDDDQRLPLPVSLPTIRQRAAYLATLTSADQ